MPGRRCGHPYGASFSSSESGTPKNRGRLVEREGFPVPLQHIELPAQHQAIGGRLRFWNKSFKASCSSPWTVFLSWAASTRSCW